MRGGGFQGGRGKRAQKPIPEEGPYRSFVGNLPNDCIQGDFDTLFNGLSINSIHMMRDRETDAFKGFAYVEFASRDDLEKALALDGADFDGHHLRIDVADDRKNDKRNNKGGFGGGQRGRGSQQGGHTGQHSGAQHGPPPGLKKDFVRPDRQHRGGSSHLPKHHEPEIDDSGFTKVERSGLRGGTRTRERGNGFKRGTGEAASSAPARSVAPGPDPERPKLNLAPRTTDPAELERRRQQDEEESKLRREKICTAKRDEE